MRAQWLSGISGSLIAGAAALVLLSKPRTAATWASAGTLAGLGIALQLRAERIARLGGDRSAPRVAMQNPADVIDVPFREVQLQ